MSKAINADFEKKVLLNIKFLIEPYLEKLKQSELNDNQLIYVSIIPLFLNLCPKSWNELRYVV